VQPSQNFYGNYGETILMSVWAAITLTLLASACMNLGLVLQKKGLSGRPLEPVNSSGELQGHRRGFRPNLTWCLGMGLLVGGYVVYGYALSARAAPISLLQPLSASGLLVVALLAVTYLHERFDALEWVGMALLLGGVIMLGFSAESRPRWNVGVDDQRLMIFLIATGLLVVLAVAAIRRRSSPARVEFLFGVLAGLLLGTGYLNTKIVSLAIQEQRQGLFITASICLGIGLVLGLVVLQMGFRRGRALIVTAVNLVTNQVLVVAGGLICLGERFPTEPWPFAARVLGLGGILAGIILLARLSAGTNGRVRTAEPAPLSGNVL
jgi:drug/metabolite transporter (DMT)-like permease